MPDDPRHRRVPAQRIWCAVLVAGVMLAPARASAFRADLQYDYQNLRIRSRVLRGDGTPVDTAFTRSFWVQTYRALESRRLRPNLDLSMQAEYTRQAYLKRDERTEAPFGQARLSHPLFGLTAAYKPVSVVQQVLAQGASGGFIDTAATRRLEYRSRESIVTGYLTPQSLPRLDVSWIRRASDATLFSPSATQQQRQARASWGRGGVSLRAGYTDLARDGNGQRLSDPFQRSYEAGAGYGFALGSKLTASAGYDFNRFDREPANAVRTRSQGHIGSLAAAFQQARTFDWNLGYQARYVEQSAFARTVTRDHEGSLTASWHPRPTHGAQVAGGIRTTRYGGWTGLQRYVSGQASAQGAIRRGWILQASAGEAVNWDGRTPAYWTTQGRVGSQMRVRRGLDLFGDWTATLNTDSTRNGSLHTNWSFGANLAPWRSFTGRGSVREARAGKVDGLVGGSSRSWALDARWTPGRSVAMLGSVNRTDVIDGSGSGTLTQTATLQWIASPRMQVSSTYSHSSSDRRTGVVVSGFGRELVSVRSDWAFSRNGSLSAGLAYVDPGTSRETREFNASWNQRLWR